MLGFLFFTSGLLIVFLTMFLILRKVFKEPPSKEYHRTTSRGGSSYISSQPTDSNTCHDSSSSDCGGSSD